MADIFRDIFVILANIFMSSTTTNNFWMALIFKFKIIFDIFHFHFYNNILFHNIPQPNADRLYPTEDAAYRDGWVCGSLSTVR